MTLRELTHKHHLISVQSVGYKSIEEAEKELNDIA